VGEVEVLGGAGRHVGDGSGRAWSARSGTWGVKS